MFIPTTKAELEKLQWPVLDIILVTGDSYIDSPHIGVALIGKVLIQAGYKVGIIAQPSLDKPDDICRLGEPLLFWGITAGSIDSMVANYTALKKPRRSDDYTPGGLNNRRPDRAVIAYTNLVRRYFKNTRPIVLGGIEASLRRISHYDYWSDKVRAPILFDAKADYLLYGMAEGSVLQLAARLKSSESLDTLPGLCWISKEAPAEFELLPSYEDVSTNHTAFISAFLTFYHNLDPLTARGLVQKKGDRYLIQNPPAPYLSQKELDAVYQIDFERLQHPYYETQGPVKALETIRFSISTHRGCYGECNFCSITMHEGRTIQWRSKESILQEALQITRLPGFKGYILDLGGPSANMYGFDCSKKLTKGACADRRCLTPEICSGLRVNHSAQIELLKSIRSLPGVKKVFISSGIRYDMLLKDSRYGKSYLGEVIEHHVSGQMKIAPEHIVDSVLSRMGKPGKNDLLKFKSLFDAMNKKAGKKQFLTYYLIAAHPGCSEREMQELKKFFSENIHIHPEQIQIYTPLPLTTSSVMYYTGLDPFSLEPVFVEKSHSGKQRQKDLIIHG